MHVEPRASGRSWTVWHGRREAGIVILVRGGRHGLRMFAAYSATADRCRWDLGSHATLELAVQRVTDFDENPKPFARRVHRVDAATVDKRR